MKLIKNVKSAVYYMQPGGSGRESLKFCTNMKFNQINRFVKMMFENNPQMRGGSYYVSVLNDEAKKENFVFRYKSCGDGIVLSPSDI